VARLLVCVGKLSLALVLTLANFLLAGLYVCVIEKKKEMGCLKPSVCSVRRHLWHLYEL
jgi:hypothetical protein